MVKGSHMTDEHKAKISAAQIGKIVSPETCARISIAKTGKPGHPWSPEMRAKMLISQTGSKRPHYRAHSLSLETRAKISVARMGNTNALGSHCSEETKAKISMAKKGKKNPHRGYIWTDEMRVRFSAVRWKGGFPESSKRAKAKRRKLGCVFLNKPFPGCEGHHVDSEQVINMPKVLHRSLYHRQDTGQGMVQMNALAYEFLFKPVTPIV